MSDEYDFTATSIRAELLSLGGDDPKARFRSRLDGEFAVQVTKEQARKLGPILYRWADLRVKVERDARETIVSGTLVDFEPVESGDAEGTIVAWEHYHRTHVSGWDTVIDIEKDLGRD